MTKSDREKRFDIVRKAASARQAWISKRFVELARQLLDQSVAAAGPGAIGTESILKELAWLKVKHGAIEVAVTDLVASRNEGSVKPRMRCPSDAEIRAAGKKKRKS